MKRSLLVSGVLALIALASPAQALEVQREGFVIGVGGGYGRLWAEGLTDNGFSLTFHAGVMLTERTAVLLDSSAVCDGSPSTNLCHSLFGLGAQFWLTDRFWVKAALGGSQNRIFGDILSDSSNIGFGVLAAAGAEVARRGTFSIDLQTRLTTSRIESVRYNTFAVMVTFNRE